MSSNHSHNRVVVFHPRAEARGTLVSVPWFYLVATFPQPHVPPRSSFLYFHISIPRARATLYLSLTPTPSPTPPSPLPPLPSLSQVHCPIFTTTHDISASNPPPSTAIEFQCVVIMPSWLVSIMATVLQGGRPKDTTTSLFVVTLLGTMYLSMNLHWMPSTT